MIVKTASRLPARLFAGILLCSTGVRAQQRDFGKLADSIHRSVYEYFYDSTAGLYTETNHRAADERPFSYLWPVCAMIQAADEMETLHPGKDHMSKVMKIVTAYYSPAPPVAGYGSYPSAKGGGDRFYDDNQWVGLAGIDAYRRTDKKEYLQLAKLIYRFMMSGYDTIAGGGIYWKETGKTSKNTCSNGPGVLLALRLYQATRQESYLDTALLLYTWTNRWLLSPEGLYYDNIRVPGRGIDSAFYTYNSGTMIQANAILYQLTRQDKYLQEAQRLAGASLQHFFRKGYFHGNYWFNAVLMRGYEELYQIDKDKQYLQAMRSYAENSRENGMGPVKASSKNVKLLDLAGYLEIVARLAVLQKVSF